MLKAIMENQDNNPSQPSVPNTNVPDPAPAAPQPAPSAPPTVSETPAVVSVSPTVSVSEPAPTVTSPPQSAPNSASASPSVPSEWPGAFKIWKTSKAAVMSNTGAIIGIIASIFAAAVVYIIVLIITRNFLNKYIVELIYELVIAMLSGALIYTMIQAVKGNKVTAGEAYSVAIKKWLYLIITAILVDILAAVSLLVFIVPFFFVMPRILLAPYYIIDQDIDPIKAIQTSWAQTKGNVGKVYGIIGVSILIIIPTITIIGVLATIYLGFMYMAAVPILYLYVTKQQSPANASPPPAAPAISTPPTPAS